MNRYTDTDSYIKSTSFATIFLISFQVLDDHPYALYKSAQNVYKENQNWTKSFLLGSGAFSTCYQARDVQSGTLMAVKQIPLNRGQDEDEKVGNLKIYYVFPLLASLENLIIELN